MLKLERKNKPEQKMCMFPMNVVPHIPSLSLSLRRRKKGGFECVLHKNEILFPSSFLLTFKNRLFIYL